MMCISAAVKFCDQMEAKATTFFPLAWTNHLAVEHVLHNILQTRVRKGQQFKVTIRPDFRGCVSVCCLQCRIYL